MQTDEPIPLEILALAQALVWERGMSEIPVGEFVDIVQRVRARLDLQGWTLVRTHDPP